MKGGLARFARLPLTDAEPRVQLLHHLTPELVWQKQFLRHPNHAVALEAVVIVADPPAVLAARLSRAAGVAVVGPIPPAAARCGFARDGCACCRRTRWNAVFPGTAIPSLPFVAGIMVRTDDGARAVARLLKTAQRCAAAAGTKAFFF